MGYALFPFKSIQPLRPRVDIQSPKARFVTGPSSIFTPLLPVPGSPKLVSLSPNTVASGDPDFTLHCIGSGFTEKTIIRFGNYDEPTTLNSFSDVSTVVKPSLFVPATVPVYVYNGTYQSNPIDFTFT